jgi:hypothetical protein
LIQNFVKIGRMVQILKLVNTNTMQQSENNLNKKALLME